MRLWWGDRGLIQGPVVVHTTFYRPWPESASQRQKTAKARWEAKHIIMKPDVGNYRKAFLDALEGIVYVNDSQVIGGNEWKAYSWSPEGWTDLRIQSTEGGR